MTDSKGQTQGQTDSDTAVEQPHLWNVVLLDDNDHTAEYVIKMMRNLFRHSEVKAFKIMETVHHTGRAICMTTHKELAELKRDQIHAFGRDPMVAECKGSMSAIIEPAEFDGDSDDEFSHDDDHPQDGQG